MAVVLGVALGFSACSSSDDASSVSDDSPATTAGDGTDATTDPAADASPVTIEHRYGSTEITERPQKIVSLDVQWTDSLLALGETPVAYIADPGAPDGFPWRDDMLADSTAMEATVVTGLPYEQIASLEPDLIVVTYFATSQEDYDKLTAIAPTIATLSDNEVDSWQDITLAAGEVLGEPDQAQTVIDDVDAQVAEVAAELPTLQGKTVAFANYISGDMIVVVSDPEDGAVVLFTQLGMVISPEIVAAGDGATGRAQLSLERVDLLNADLLLLLTNGLDPSKIPGYDSLPAVTTGAVNLLDYATATALNTPSPLSIPYGLEQVRPALEAAAAE